MNPDGLDPATSREADLQRLSAFQVIVLGSGGGPLEDNVTGLLVRSTSTKWAKGSVLAVDAGVHLAAVTEIIHEHLPRARSKNAPLLDNGAHQVHSNLSAPATGQHKPPANSSDTKRNSSSAEAMHADMSKSQLVLSTGPFADFELPHRTAKANAAYFVRNLITTYLITHPHLDHISGFVINTAGFQHTSRPKRLAGLPWTIDAFKTHIFNDTIWPNLSDEDGGVGLVSYMRLAEGGNLAIGDGEGRGYIEVCDGIAVKGWGVSHGKCMHNHGKRASGSGHNLEQFSDSFSRRASASAGTPNSLQHGRDHLQVEPCVIDSSAFFLRDDHTGHEILIFGDVEPDVLSLSPRTQQVWADAAPKVANGLLKAIFIECSYDESQPDETLFGHLAPRHIIAELKALAAKVVAHKNSVRRGSTPLKRKRRSNDASLPEHSYARRPRRSQQSRRKSWRSNTSTANVPNEGSEDGHSNSLPRDSSVPPENPATTDENMDSCSPDHVSASGPLAGMQIIIIHVKDNLKDEPDAGDTILKELRASDTEASLGCRFAISKSGSSVWL